jgi:ectoine hydroxylase-related dioxygenase (phytanoyl-CoA dioxygenase family)
MTESSIPKESYGILQQNKIKTVCDEAVEKIRNLGYAVISSEYTVTELQSISEEFNRTRENYTKEHGEDKLKSLNEFYTIRSPLTHGGEWFLKLSMNKNVLSVVEKLISGKFILNQQNGVINPAQKSYNQGAWHRDLPYQHFVSSKPLAINALFCVDDFTLDNGSTFVLPASHKSDAYPSENYIQKNAVQVEAKAGSFILLDCMIFHTGGFNATGVERRAVNHVYNIPYFKQQINIPLNIMNVDLSVKEKEILGFNYMEPNSIVDYLADRV